MGCRRGGSWILLCWCHRLLFAFLLEKKNDNENDDNDDHNSDANADVQHLFTQFFAYPDIDLAHGSSVYSAPLDRLT